MSERYQGNASVKDLMMNIGDGMKRLPIKENIKLKEITGNTLQDGNE